MNSGDWDEAGELYRTVRSAGRAARQWDEVKGAEARLVLVPWAFRANRGGKIHVRVPWMRVADA